MVLLEYHADGLWVTQPDWRTAYPVEEELGIAASHLQELTLSLAQSRMCQQTNGGVFLWNVFATVVHGLLGTGSLERMPTPLQDTIG